MVSTLERQKNIHVAGIIVSLILLYKLFALNYTFYKVQALFLCLLALYLGSLILRFLIRRTKISFIELFFIFLLISVPIYSAYIGYISLGQPYLYGLLTERRWLLVILGIVFYRGIVYGNITIRELERAFVYMAWSCLIGYLFIVVIFGKGMIGGDSALVRETASRVRLTLPVDFIVFGVFYYFSKWLLLKRKVWFLSFLSFLFYLVFVYQGRTMLIFVSATIFTVLWFNMKGNRWLFLLIGLYIISCIFLLTYMLAPEYLFKMLSLFNEMFHVLVGVEGSDVSANSRLWQFDIVWNYWQNNFNSLLCGMGKVSNQWQGGYRALFGYFYPTDIGVIGGVFVYGLIGSIFMFFLPVWFVFKVYLKTSNVDNVFVASLRVLCLFYLYQGVQGTFYFSPAKYSIVLLIVFGWIRSQRNLLYHGS